MFNKTRKAFTMLELMIVIALIGVIMAYVGPKIAEMLSQRTEAEIKFKIANLKSSLNEYRLVFGSYPTTKQGLQALVTNPRNREFAKATDIEDNNHNPLIYYCPVEKNKGKFKHFEIIYLGATQEENAQDRIDEGI